MDNTSICLVYNMIRELGTAAMADKCKRISSINTWINLIMCCLLKTLFV